MRPGVSRSTPGPLPIHLSTSHTPNGRYKNVAGAAVKEGAGYALTDKSLTLLAPPAGAFELEVVTSIR